MDAMKLFIMVHHNNFKHNWPQKTIFNLINQN